jgi:hypothetical protein
MSPALVPLSSFYYSPIHFGRTLDGFCRPQVVKLIPVSGAADKKQRFSSADERDVRPLMVAPWTFGHVFKNTQAMKRCNGIRGTCACACHERVG